MRARPHVVFIIVIIIDDSGLLALELTRRVRADQLIIIVMTTNIRNAMRAVVLMWGILTDMVFMSTVTTIGRLHIVVVTVCSILVMEYLFLLQLVFYTV